MVLLYGLAVVSLYTVRMLYIVIQIAVAVVAAVNFYFLAHRTFPRLIGECGGKNYHLVHPSADVGKLNP